MAEQSVAPSTDANTQAEKRRHVRFLADGEAAIRTNTAEFLAVLVDASPGGLKLASLRPLPLSPGQPVEVTFVPRGLSEQTTVAGRVAAVRSAFIGVSFSETKWWDSLRRKLHTFRTVSQKKTDTPSTPADIIAAIAAEQRRAASSSELAAKTAGLWKMESLGVTFARLAQPGDTLNRSELPAEARPIAHVGMGAGVVEVANFDPARIAALIDSFSDPYYRLFAYESLGAMLGVYEKQMPRLMLGLKALDRPDPAAFISAFPSEVRRLISHGFGRLLYFNSKDIQGALRNVLDRTFLDPAAAVQGMAFGYAMVNHRELGVVLETGGALLDPERVKAFHTGLVYALMFWEWTYPGCLDSLHFDGPAAKRLVSAAAEETASAREQGALPAFAVRRFTP